MEPIAIPRKAASILKRVKKFFLNDPERLDMSSWGTKHGATPCGTTACIGGAICLLEAPRRIKWVDGEMVPRSAKYEDIPALAAELIGLEPSEIDNLFYTDGVYGKWPASFRRRFQRTNSQETRAQIAGERIDHFIATCE